VRPRLLTALKVLVFLLALAPFLRLVYLGVQSYQGTGDGLGVNPVETVTHKTGDLTIYFLLITMTVTPIRRVAGLFKKGALGWVLRFRRMLGLFAFFYVCLHYSTYLFDRSYVEQALDLRSILKDVSKRPYIIVGTLGLLLMTPLAITSTAGMIRRLGKRWQTLHRLIYVCAILGIVHWTWLVKVDTRRPLFFGSILFGLLLIRMAFYVRDRYAAKTK
jgi:sulfoxide reductase heme-binding subunit YedZ